MCTFEKTSSVTAVDNSRLSDQVICGSDGVLFESSPLSVSVG